MKARIVVLVLIIAVIGYLAFFNLNYLMQDVPTSLGFAMVHIPLGLVLLGLTTLMAAVFVAYVIAMQGAWLLESRAHTKEMQAQRELADKAEASRFTELRTVIEQLHHDNEQRLAARLDTLQAQMNARATDAENTTAAYMGQIEQQLRTPPAPGNTGAPRDPLL